MGICYMIGLNEAAIMKPGKSHFPKEKGDERCYKKRGEKRNYKEINKKKEGNEEIMLGSKGKNGYHSLIYL